MPALSETDRNAIQAIRFEKSNETHGTPALFTLLKILGAFLLRAIKSIVREEIYSEELPALRTAITITALISDAPALMPASESAMVNGDLAVLDPAARRLSSSHGIKMPMKKTVPT